MAQSIDRLPRQLAFISELDKLKGVLRQTRGGGTWRLHGVTRDQVLARMDPIREASPALWTYVLTTIGEVYAGGEVLDAGSVA